MTGGACWGSVASPALFVLGAGLGVLMGALAAVGCWALGWAHWTPTAGFPRPTPQDAEALWREIERRR